MAYHLHTETTDNGYFANTKPSAISILIYLTHPAYKYLNTMKHTFINALHQYLLVLRLTLPSIIEVLRLRLLKLLHTIQSTCQLYLSGDVFTWPAVKVKEPTIMYIGAPATGN